MRMCVRHVVEGALAWAWASRARVLETDVCAVGVSVGVEGVGVSVVGEGKQSCQQNQKKNFYKYIPIVLHEESPSRVSSEGGGARVATRWKKRRGGRLALSARVRGEGEAVRQ